MTVIDASIDTIVVDPDRPARAAPISAEEDAALRASINAWGVLQPILLRQRGNQLVLVKGARRLAAARDCGKADLPARIFAEADPITDAAIRATAMVRAPINPVDRWRAIQQLLDSGLTLDRAAETLGVDPRGARRLQRLGSIIPPILDALAQQPQVRDDEVHRIASAPPEVQRAAWKAHGKEARSTGRWWSLAAACRVTVIHYSVAKFDDAAAARHRVTWEEDLFAPADKDSRHTTNVAGFKAAQQEWMEAQVQGLIGQGYQAEILPQGKHGMAEVPKGMERQAGKPDKAPKTVIRGLWMDTQGEVHTVLYKRPKPPEAAAKGKGGKAGGASGKATAAPEPAKPPRGISKKGLVLIAEAKEAALRQLLADDSEWAPTDLDVLLQAILTALAASNVAITEGRHSRVSMADIARKVARDDAASTGAGVLVGAAREALALMLHAPRPEQFESGRAFDACADIINTQPPRVDTLEILSELPKAMLQDLASAHGVKRSLTAAAIARELAGKLPDWRPAEALFTATPAAESDDAEDDVVTAGDDAGGDDDTEATLEDAA